MWKAEGLDDQYSAETWKKINDRRELKRKIRESESSSGVYIQPKRGSDETVQEKQELMGREGCRGSTESCRAEPP